ncbi:hypothetical protein EG835_01960, partial [bacterium]|nr:hypothetical protein [bacterium]
MYYVVGVIVLVALVGLALLIRFISGGDTRIGLWSVLLVLAVVIAAMLGQLASIYYRPPLGWIAAVVASVLLVAAVFWLIGRNVAWKAPRVLALVGLVLAS